MRERLHKHLLKIGGNLWLKIKKIEILDYRRRRSQRRDALRRIAAHRPSGLRGRQEGRPICSLPAIPSLPHSLSDQPAHLPNLYGRQIASDPAGLNLIAARRDRWRWMTCGDQSNTPHHATTGEPCPNPAPPYPDDNEGGLYIFVGKYIKMRMKDETCVCRRLVAFPLPPLSMQRTKTAPQRHRRSHSFWETARYSSAATSDLAVSSSRIHASFGTRPLPPSVRPSVRPKWDIYLRFLMTTIPTLFWHAAAAPAETGKEGSI